MAKNRAEPSCLKGAFPFQGRAPFLFVFDVAASPFTAPFVKDERYMNAVHHPRAAILLSFFRCVTKK